MSLLPTRRQYATLILISEVSASFEDNVVPEALVDAICHRMDVKPKGLRDERWIVLDQSAGYRIDSKKMPGRGDGLSGPAPKPLPEEAAENLLSHWTAGVRDIEHQHFLSPANKKSAYRCPLDGSQLVDCLADIAFVIQVKKGTLSGHELGNVVARYVSTDAFQLRQFLLQEGYVSGRATFTIATKGRIRIEQAKAVSKLTRELVTASVLEKGGEQDSDVPAPSRESANGSQKPPAAITNDPTTWPERPLEAGGSRDLPPKKKAYDKEGLDETIFRVFVNAPNYDDLRLAFMRIRRMSVGQTDQMRAACTTDGTAPARSKLSQATTAADAPTKEGPGAIPVRAKHHIALTIIDAHVATSADGSFQGNDVERALRLAGIRTPSSQTLHELSRLGLLDVVEKGGPRKPGRYRRSSSPYVRDDGATPPAPAMQTNEKNETFVHVTRSHFDALALIDAASATNADRTFGPEDIADDLLAKGIQTRVSQIVYALRAMRLVEVVHKGGRGGPGRYRRTETEYALHGHLPLTHDKTTAVPETTVEAALEPTPDTAAETPVPTPPEATEPKLVPGPVDTAEPAHAVSTPVSDVVPPFVAAVEAAAPVASASPPSVLDGLEDMRRKLQARVEERTRLLREATEALAPRQQRIRLLRAYLGIMGNAIVTCDDALVRGRLCQRKRDAESELNGYDLDKEEALQRELETELGADELELAALCAEIDRLTPATDD